jgi:hypothetical protein
LRVGMRRRRSKCGDVGRVKFWCNQYTAWWLIYGYYVVNILLIHC